MSPNTKVPTKTLITCDKCGGKRYISRRHWLAIRAGEHSTLCPECRLKPTKITSSQTYRNYWLTRYTMEEIRQMAAGLDMLLNDHSRPARPAHRKRQGQDPQAAQ